MNVIEDPTDFNPLSTLVFLTGDGRREFEVIKSLPKRYPRNKNLLVAKLPYSKSGTGLHALKAVQTNLSHYKVRNTLCLVDKDSFTNRNPNPQSMERESRCAFNTYGVRVNNIRHINVGHETVFVINGEITGRGEVVIYLGIIGGEKCIEEDIAILIKLELNENVEPDKHEIRALLRRHDILLPTLIERATINNLSQAFPALHEITRTC